MVSLEIVQRIPILTVLDSILEENLQCRFSVLLVHAFTVAVQDALLVEFRLVPVCKSCENIDFRIVEPAISESVISSGFLKRRHLPESIETDSRS